MTEVNIQLNPAASPRVILVGEEQTPVVIIDDFAKDAGELIRYAVNSANFAPVEVRFYPGYRAKPPSGYLQEIVRVIVPLLGRVYSVPGDAAIKLLTGRHPSLPLP